MAPTKLTLAKLKLKRLTGCLLLAVGLLAGCGGETPAPAPDPGAKPVVQVNPPVPVANPGVEPPANEPDKLETKWIGNIPYDVFFDQPLVVATDTRPVNPASPGNPLPPVENPTLVANVPVPQPPAGNAPSSPMPAAGAGPDWRDILPMAVLVEEVKLLRTRLTESLNTLPVYNKSFKAVANDAAILATLSALVTVHPEEVSWKPRAAFIRELAKEIAAASTGTGRENFDKCRDKFEDLRTLLDGGTPPNQTSQPVIPFAEVAQVADMMQRIDGTFTSLKANVRASNDFKTDAARIERDLRIMLALGTLIGDRSYDSTDQTPYQQQQRAFTTGLRDALTASGSVDVDGFQSALGRVQTSCAECHRQYRSGDTGF